MEILTKGLYGFPDNRQSQNCFDNLLNYFRSIVVRGRTKFARRRTRKRGATNFQLAAIFLRKVCPVYLNTMNQKKGNDKCHYMLNKCRQGIRRRFHFIVICDYHDSMGFTLFCFLWRCILKQDQSHTINQIICVKPFC